MKIRYDWKKIRIVAFVVSAVLFILLETNEWNVNIKTVYAATTLTNENVYINTSTCKYNGKEKRPSIVVIVKGRKLEQNKDFKVAYKNNVKPGTAKAVVKPHFIPGDFLRIFRTKLSAIKCSKDRDSRLNQRKPQVSVALIQPNVCEIRLN